MEPEGAAVAQVPCPFCSWSTRVIIRRPAPAEPPGSLMLHLQLHVREMTQAHLLA